MPKPTFSDYLEFLRQRFKASQEAVPEPTRRGPNYPYPQVSLLLFFVGMLLRHKYGAKAQRRWLEEHSNERGLFGLEQIPSRWTLRRRWKKLYPMLQGFLAWLGDWAEDPDEAFQDTAWSRTRACSKLRVPSGIRRIGELGGSPKVCAPWIPRPPGPSPRIMAGSMDTRGIGPRPRRPSPRPW